MTRWQADAASDLLDGANELCVDTRVVYVVRIISKYINIQKYYAK